MTTAKKPLLNSTLRWFLLAMILANIAGEMLYALVAVYMTQLGASVGQVGLVFTLAAIVPLVLQILGGWLSDTIGRLRTIAIGSAVSCLGYVLFPLAPTWQWILPALALDYVSNSLVGPSFSAFIAEQSSEENRGRVYGLSKGIFLTVAVIGPALGGFLAFQYGFRVMLAVAAGLYLTAAALRVWMATSARFGARSAAERPTLSSLGASLKGMYLLLAAGGIVTWILVTDGVQDIAYTLSGDLQPVYLSQIGGLDAARIGMLQSLRGAAMVVTTLVAGWLSDRYGERRLIASGFLLEFLALMIFTQSTAIGGFAAASIVWGLGFGAIIPAYDSLISKSVPDKMRGIAYGVFGTSIGLLSLPAPWLGGQLWERIAPQAPFLVTALAVLACLAPVLLKFKLPPKAEPETAAAPAVGAAEPEAGVVAPSR
jgi:MFS family permease